MVDALCERDASLAEVDDRLERRSSIDGESLLVNVATCVDLVSGAR